MRVAFSLFYADSNSCAGKIGIALEKLMDHLNIDSETVDEKGKAHKLTLHERIVKYAQIEPSIATNILALKWLRNTAVHETINISKSEVLDALEITEFVLSEIIEQRSAKIAKMAARLTKKHS